MSAIEGRPLHPRHVTPVAPVEVAATDVVAHVIIGWLLGVTVAGDFNNRDTIVILLRLLFYYHDGVAIVKITSDSHAEIMRTLSQCYSTDVLSLYFNVTWHTLHAARFLSIISPLFQLNEAEMLPYAGFPVHILTISILSSIL